MRRQQGAALVMVALSTTVLLLTFGLVANVGMLYLEHTRMQAAADAAALAGARALPDGATAAAEQALALGTANGYEVGSQDLVIGSDRVRVRCQHPHDFWLGFLLDRAGMTLGVTAEALLVNRGLRYGLRPFGVPRRPAELVAGREYALKVGSDPTDGNFQALALEGRGAADYRSLIVQGSSREFAVGQAVETEPGNMVGPTVSGVAELVANDPTPYAKALKQPERTPRVITVPLLDPEDWGDLAGRSAVTIAHFAQFYLTRTDSTGGVWGRFIGCPDVGRMPGTGYQYAAKLID